MRHTCFVAQAATPGVLLLRPSKEPKEKSTDNLDALEPRAVVAGHKIPDHDDDPRNIAETRKYLSDFIRLDQTTDTPRALFDAMIELYPARANPGSLWGGATAAKSEAGNGSPSAATTEK